MIAKRLGATALAAILILGALLVRDRVIEGSGDDEEPRSRRELVCVTDLRAACEALERDDLDVRIEDAATTLDALAELADPADAPMWVTIAPFPDMVDNLRAIAGEVELATSQTRVASSPIALVVPADRAPILARECGEPLAWQCVGDAAGQPWTEIGGAESWRDVRPAFAPISTALGLLGVAGATSGYFGSGPIQLGDTDFVVWARRLARAVPANQITGETAIATITTRASALDIAVGAAAELPAARASDLTLQYADPMIRADVVVAVPEGAPPPNGLVDDLRRVLVGSGWVDPATDLNPLPTAVDMLAIAATWDGLA